MGIIPRPNFHLQAVASPRHLLDESKRDVALYTPKESNNNSNSNSNNSNSNNFFHDFGSSIGKSELDYYYSGFYYGDAYDDSDDDDDSNGKISGGRCSSTGSEESFSEPDPFDPTDGGLPCVARFLQGRATVFPGRTTY